jgi:hypothetical protein
MIIPAKDAEKFDADLSEIYSKCCRLMTAIDDCSIVAIVSAALDIRKSVGHLSEYFAYLTGPIAQARYISNADTENSGGDTA